MTNASTLGDMSPELLKVVERARREPEGRFHSLAHLIDVPALERAYDRMRKDAGRGRGWNDEGAVRTGPGGAAPGPARPVAVEALPASTNPSHPHSEGTG
jgi:hypothetical protein